MRYLNRKFFSFAGCIVVIFALWACAKPAQQAVEIKHYPIDALDGIITQSGIQFDTGISRDGKGSLKIASGGTNGNTTFRDRRYRY